MRARIFAFAIACIMVAPQADAQGNRGNSNGVPGSIANVQAIVDAVRAQLAALVSSLPALTTLQSEVTSLRTAVTNLTARLDAAVARLDTKIDTADARLDTRIDNLQGQLATLNGRMDLAESSLSTQDARLDGVDSQLSAFDTTLGTLSRDISALTTRLAALETAPGGGAGVPIIWSGGCTNRGVAATAGTLVTYCTNGEDPFGTMGTRLTRSDEGLFTVNVSGYYRINYWGVGRSTQSKVQLATLDGTVTNGHDSAGGTISFRDVSSDVIWPFDVDDMFAIQVHAQGGNAGDPPYAYDAWAPVGLNPASRLQIEYLGPLPE